MKLIAVAIALSLPLIPLPGRADAISLNGVCQYGDCSNPAILTPGQTTTHDFDYTYAFQNGDTYRLTGTSLDINGSPRTTGALLINNFVATHEGNAAGTTSFTDVLIAEFSQQYQFTRTVAVQQQEMLAGSFGAGVSSSSSVSGQGYINSKIFPLLGPVNAPPADYFVSTTVPITIPAGISIYDFQYTFTFGEGSQLGSSISLFPSTPPPVSPVPEPSSIILLGTGVLGCIGRLKRRRRRQE